jgi:hypothetical protein
MQESKVVNRVAITSTTREGIDQVRRFVNFHLSGGVDKVFLFYDGVPDWPADAFADDPRVTFTVCDKAYWDKSGGRPAHIDARLMHNADVGRAGAESAGMDWIIHIDNDELLFSEQSIAAVLTDAKKDVVRFGMHEAVAEKVDYDSIFDATTFRVWIDAAKRAAVQADPLLAPLLFEGEYFRGHSASKVAIRIKALRGRVGIHKPTGPEIEEERTNKIILLHFDCVGVAAWAKKWSMRIDSSGPSNMRKNRREQMSMFAGGRAVPETVREDYDRLYVVTPQQTEAALRRGIMKTIRIDPSRFERPAG